MRLRPDQVRTWAEHARAHTPLPEIFRDLFRRMQDKKSPPNVQEAAKALAFEILKQEKDIPSDAELMDMRWHAHGGVKTIAKIVYKDRGELIGRTLNIPLKGQERHFQNEARNRLRIQEKIAPIFLELKQSVEKLQKIARRSEAEEKALQSLKRDIASRELRLMALTKTPLEEKAMDKGYYLSAFLVGETLMEEFDRAFRNAYPQADPLNEEAYAALQNQYAEEHPEIVRAIIKKMFHATWTFLKDTNMTVLPGDIHPGNIMMIMVLGLMNAKVEPGLFDFGVVGIPSAKDGIHYPGDIPGSLHQVLALYLDQARKSGSSPQRTNMEFASGMPSKLNFYKIFQPSEGEKMLANPMAMEVFIDSIRDAFGEQARQELYARLKDERLVSGSPMAVFRAHLAVLYEPPLIDIQQAFVRGKAALLTQALLQRKQAVEDLLALAMEDERFSAQQLKLLRAWKDKDLRQFLTVGVPSIMQILSSPRGQEDTWSLGEFERSLDAMGSRMRLENLELLPGEPHQLQTLSFDMSPEQKRVLKDLFIRMRQMRYQDPLRMGDAMLQEFFRPQEFIRARDAGLPLDPGASDFSSAMAGESLSARLAGRTRGWMRRMGALTGLAVPADSFSHFTGITMRENSALLETAGSALRQEGQAVASEKFTTFLEMMQTQEKHFNDAIDREAEKDRFLSLNRERLKDAMRVAINTFREDVPRDGVDVRVTWPVYGNMRLVFVPRQKLWQRTGYPTNSYKTSIGNTRYMFLATELLQEKPTVLLQVFVHELLEDQQAPHVHEKMDFFSHTVLRGYEALFNENPRHRHLGKVSDVMRMDMRIGGPAYVLDLTNEENIQNRVVAIEIPQKIRLRHINSEQQRWVLALAQDVKSVAEMFLAGKDLDGSVNGRRHTASAL